MKFELCDICGKNIIKKPWKLDSDYSTKKVEDICETCLKRARNTIGLSRNKAKYKIYLNSLRKKLAKERSKNIKKMKKTFLGG